ncbi:flavodoxin [Lacihabitans sp. CCS-44]|uniref:flavodoxin n=1 Tax=Lacihabitans sp. CCS-44 TaxID=2487331 RepID=UPI0020CCE3F1|nr:flavodoxin [Lacihabitans sp. CCS-44]MCP9757185.1 flavodoxin [Lacihabitans sp. CCS-44]
MKLNRSIAVLFLFLQTCCSQAQPQTAGENGKGKNILIVYLSRTNCTKVVAEMIHQKVGGKIVALELEKAYPENYRATVEQVSNELRTGFLPPLKTRIENWSQYDFIFIGFPTWAMSLPPPMQSFLHQYNFEGKTLVPFNTNGGYGLGSTIEKIKEICPKATVKEAFTVFGGKEPEGTHLTLESERGKEVKQMIYDWLEKIKLD